MHLAAPVAVNRTYLKLEKGASFLGLEIIAKLVTVLEQAELLKSICEVLIVPAP